MTSQQGDIHGIVNIGLGIGHYTVGLYVTEGLQLISRKYNVQGIVKNGIASGSILWDNIKLTDRKIKVNTFNERPCFLPYITENTME